MKFEGSTGNPVLEALMLCIKNALETDATEQLIMYQKWKG